MFHAKEPWSFYSSCANTDFWVNLQLFPEYTSSLQANNNLLGGSPILKHEIRRWLHDIRNKVKRNLGI
uniref:Uncharacterized protein n=1 Tax=Manihot esculenta TaxID=3983 RepID=A0A2C9UYQ5_MANES